MYVRNRTCLRGIFFIFTGIFANICGRVNVHWSRRNRIEVISFAKLEERLDFFTFRGDYGGIFVAFVSDGTRRADREGKCGCVRFWKNARSLLG